MRSRFHADELFWFNRISGTVSTVASTATAALPSGMRIPLVVSYLGEALEKVSLEDIEAVYNATTPVTGQPTQWAEDGGLLHFYPTPNAVYALLGVSGSRTFGVPVTTNDWTTTGFQLILARAKKILYRGPLRDPDGMALMEAAEEEALTKLRRETRRRARSNATTDLPVPTGFNIVTGL
jgi:hypothetical protein